MITDRPKLNVWITKYALTQGIFNIDVLHCVDINVDMVSDLKPYGGSCYHKPDWHLTREEAVERAEVMRKKKIKSLKVSLRVLEDLSF